MIKKILYILTILMIGTQVAAAEQNPIFTTYPAHEHQGSKQWIISNVARDTKYSDQIIVENLTDSIIDLKIEFKETSGTKENIQINESSNFNNIGNWIKLEKQTVTLNPHEKSPVKVEISIPSDAEYTEYQGTILVSNTQASNNSAMNIATRIGNRVYLTVKAGNDFKASISEAGQTPWQIALIALGMIGIGYSLKKQKQK